MTRYNIDSMSSLIHRLHVQYIYLIGVVVVQWFIHETPNTKVEGLNPSLARYLFTFTTLHPDVNGYGEKSRLCSMG